MIKITIVRSGDGAIFDLGQVSTLNEGKEIVQKLDQEYMAYVASGCIPLLDNNPLTAYEGGDIWAEDGNKNWWFNNEDEWEKLGAVL
jgi:hypothetical protein